MENSLLKFDRFRKNRGGYSRLLRLTCEKCANQITLYQKDGPGPLKRLYVDRIVKSSVKIDGKFLNCDSCKEVLGVKIIYKKENAFDF